MRRKGRQIQVGLGRREALTRPCKDVFINSTSVDTYDTRTLETLPKRPLRDLSEIRLSQELHDLEKNGLGKMTALEVTGGYIDNARSIASLNLSRQLHSTGNTEVIDSSANGMLEVSYSETLIASLDSHDVHRLREWSEKFPTST